VKLSIAFLLLSIEIAFSFSPAEGKYVPIPNGYAHEQCIYSMNENFDLRRYKGGKGFEFVATTSISGVETKIPDCPFPLLRSDNFERHLKPSMLPTHGPAWKTWAQYQTSNITNLVGQWPVPPNPTVQSDGQLLYFWNGVEPNDNSEVLQPVLQWGSSPVGGGNYWAVASWFVSSSGNVVTSPLMNVNIGDVIVGTLTLLSNGSWEVIGTDSNMKNSTMFTYTPDESNYDYAYEVLEAYSIAECSDYPTSGKVPFTNIVVEALGKVVQPTWTPMVKNNNCQENTIVVSPSAVTIQFKTA